MHRGEIYLANLGTDDSHVQMGIRPVVICQNDIGNLCSKTTIVAPLTSRVKKPIPTHSVTMATGIKSTVLSEQIRTVEKDWLGKKIGELSAAEIKDMDRALAISLGLV